MSEPESGTHRGDPPPTGATAYGGAPTGAGDRPDPAPGGSAASSHVPPGYGAPGYGPPPAQPGPGHAPPGYGAPAGYAPAGYGTQPGFGAPPGYAPPGYGLPGYAPPGWRRPTNTTAILAVVLAFVFAPAGLVLGLVARRQIRETGEEGDGLALAGIIVGGLVTSLVALGILLMVIGLAVVQTSY